MCVADPALFIFLVGLGQPEEPEKIRVKKREVFMTFLLLVGVHGGDSGRPEACSWRVRFFWILACSRADFL